jgi:succinyl-CoA synthetase beta subunit
MSALLRRFAPVSFRGDHKIANRLVQSSLLTTPRRFLDLHEYQSKDLATRYGVRVQKGYMAETPEETEAHAAQLLADGAPELVLKAQIHAGGRGKGVFDTGFKSGVQFSTDPAEMAGYAREMLGNNLITKQTPPEGQNVKKVLVHESLNFSKDHPEFYLAFLMDRSFDGPVMVASREGGMDIEEVAERNPDAIIKQGIDITEGIQPAQTLAMAQALGLEGDLVADAQAQMESLYNMFLDLDCTQIEINPMVVSSAGQMYCVDAKLNFDDNASFRQKEVFSMRDTSMEDSREVAAGEAGLNYVGLDGSIGCMVNGAGLAMATMDIIHLYGGEPANFLDVGGGATESQVEAAFRILTEDPKVKGILVNIFGGIMKCDVIAQGIVNAAKTINLQIPLVVRLEGTNVEIGNEILSSSGINLITANDLDDAAVKAVAAIQ